jgi:hypothetical protein
MRDALQFRILISIKEDNLRGLDAISQGVLRGILQKNHEIAVHTAQIVNQQQIDESVASRRHQELLDSITHQRIPATHIEDITKEVQDRLFFHRRNDRFDDIAEAHRTTFQWTLTKPGAKTMPWPNLLQWLREDSGIYWISGKAGSGKSTLMKYLHQDSRTMDALNAWAGDDGLLVITFYFWNAGTYLQRSQEGLLRSLLWQVLVHKPSLCSALFPEQFTYTTAWNEFPTMHQLRRAFKKLTDLRHNPTKIALLVDGLDEFDAQHFTTAELANMFLQICKSANVKALLSSRPLTSFEDAFALQPKLRLHQLTHDDITMYIEDRLAKAPELSILEPPNSNNTRDLVEEIVGSASGVFLWVKLVVDSLLRGIQAGDEFRDLWARLRLLPRDLEDLFRHMLNSVPSEYQEQGSRIFQLLRCNEKSIMFNEAGTLYVFPALLSVAKLRFAEAQQSEVTGNVYAQPSDLEREQMDRIVERRLQSRCAGLLELRTSHARRLFAQTNMDNILRIREIVYIHKTVADFIGQSEVWAELLSFTKGTDFVAPRALLQALIMEAKVQDDSLRSLDELWFMIHRAMYFARMIEEISGSGSQDLLDQLDHTMLHHFPNPKGKSDLGVYDAASWCDAYFPHINFTTPVPWHTNFLALTVRFGLSMYVQENIRKSGPRVLEKEGRPLLDYVCYPVPLAGDWQKFVSLHLVELLLKNGADPNSQFNGSSPWQNALSAPLRDITKWIGILKLLILYGADPNAYIEDSVSGLERWSVLYMWTAGLEDHDSQGSFCLTESGRAELKEHAPEMQTLLIERGAVSRRWTLNIAKQWTENDPDYAFNAVAASDQTTGPDAALTTGVSEEAANVKAKHREDSSAKSPSSLRKVSLRIKSRLRRLRQRQRD